MKDTKVITKLNKLIKEGEELIGKLWCAPLISYRSATIEMNRLHYREAEKWKIDSIQILKLRFGRNSIYYQEFENAINSKYKSASKYCKENVSRALAIIESSLEAIKSGLTEDLFYQKEIILFGSLLDQAYEFLKKNYSLVALIYGRIVLESTIKEFAKSKELNEVGKLKFNQIIIELKKREIITQPTEHSLRAQYSLGSSFHNLEEFKKIKKNQIKSFLDFIRDNVLTL